MKKIAVVTTTRAEYGLLSPLIKELRKFEDDSFKVDLIVSGTHLSEEYGMTINEINDRVDHEISIPVKSASALDISHNQAQALEKFTGYFAEQSYNAVILLGDRYETLAVALSAGNTGTPIFHLCGGDITEGAIDEWIRHSITKISYLHFTTNEESRRRVIQLGEDPSRVYNFGSTSIDNVLSVADMNRTDALKSIDLTDCRFALCTFHPETLGSVNIDDQLNELLYAIKAFPNIHFIVTKSNADRGGARINELLDEADKTMENVRVYSSLGARRYLSLMKHSEFVLGNSSSGIIETPAFHVPTVNIGDRQRGRLQSASIINCECKKDAIVDAINHALSKQHKELCAITDNPYGSGHSGERIANRIIDTLKRGNLDLKKKFYDIKVVE